jgi:hypothetical protein
MDTRHIAFEYKFTIKQLLVHAIYGKKSNLDFIGRHFILKKKIFLFIDKVKCDNIDII